jgi:hypothetical protein
MNKIEKMKLAKKGGDSNNKEAIKSSDKKIKES